MKKWGHLPNRFVKINDETNKQFTPKKIRQR
jgi:hypothetical protein